MSPVDGWVLGLLLADTLSTLSCVLLAWQGTDTDREGEREHQTNPLKPNQFTGPYYTKGTKGERERGRETV